MQKAQRTQVDELQEAYSNEAAIDFTGTPDKARQEYKDEADINVLLGRFGVHAPQKQMVFGQEVDYNLDLQQALTAIADAKTAHRELPENLRERYPTWQSLLNALETGALTMHNEEPIPTEEPPK